MVDVILHAMATAQDPRAHHAQRHEVQQRHARHVTGEAKCVVDLDTVMPGCALYDFGDMVRTTTSPTLEDEPTCRRSAMQMPMFKKLAEGYLSTAGQFLTRAEKALIAFSGKLITFEIGMRFLTDYPQRRHLLPHPPARPQPRSVPHPVQTCGIHRAAGGGDAEACGQVVRGKRPQRVCALPKPSGIRRRLWI